MTQREYLEWLQSSENEFGAVLERLLGNPIPHYTFPVRWMTGLPA